MNKYMNIPPEGDMQGGILINLWGKFIIMESPIFIYGAKS